jgi:cytochrome b subunit of formate dehydrogenase
MSAVGALAGVHYLESIHGKALITKGLMVAPSCLDCHGSAHQLRPVKDEASLTSRKRVAETCGKCHEGIRQKYEASTHAAALAKGNERAPTCPTCHTAHDIAAARGNFAQGSDKTCGQCHATRRNQYLDTYHGRAHALGDATVAACFDCHQSHDVIDTSDPRSSLSEQNRVATCRKCHSNANRNFATFMPHADHGDREKYPSLYYTYLAMTGLLLGTFAFFGLHTAFWFGRSMVAFFRDPKGFRELKRNAKLRRGERVYRRFRPVDRFCHLLVVISFLLLVATGMPLKFHDAPWAIEIFDILGGPKAAARLHRFGALLTFSYFAIHLLSLVGPIRRRREQYQTDGKFDWKKFLRLVFGPDSPVPNLQDARDLAAHTKWFFGKGPRPTFDRFTYWEKFDYMAVFWGVTVIGLSGLVMWFPVATTRVLPGWLINVAHIVHSDEALLAAGFIFTFHFFNGHFRPEKFPLDPVIFSGAITESEFQHERGRQYERLVRSGELENLRTSTTEWESWKWVLTPFGAIALTVGLTLVVAIFWAILTLGH